MERRRREERNGEEEEVNMARGCKRLPPQAGVVVEVKKGRADPSSQTDCARLSPRTIVPMSFAPHTIATTLHH